MSFVPQRLFHNDAMRSTPQIGCDYQLFFKRARINKALRVHTSFGGSLARISYGSSRMLSMTVKTQLEKCSGGKDFLCKNQTSLGHYGEEIFVCDHHFSICEGNSQSETSFGLLQMYS